MEAPRIIIGADHAGFALKERIKRHLEENGFEVIDVGTHGDASVDYPDFGAPVATAVSRGEFSRGILICASGVGMSIVANRFPGVRAVLARDEETALMSRLHNDTNILVLAGKMTIDKTALKITSVWLDTPFESGRHARRLDKITQIEKQLGQLTQRVESKERQCPTL